MILDRNIPPEVLILPIKDIEPRLFYYLVSQYSTDELPPVIEAEGTEFQLNYLTRQTFEIFLFRTRRQYSSWLKSIRARHEQGLLLQYRFITKGFNVNYGGMISTLEEWIREGVEDPFDPTLGD